MHSIKRVFLLSSSKTDLTQKYANKFVLSPLKAVNLLVSLFVIRYHCHLDNDFIEFSIIAI